MKKKTDRNQRLFAYWKKHYPEMSYEDIGRVFHLDKPRTWRIIQRIRNGN